MPQIESRQSTYSNNSHLTSFVTFPRGSYRPSSGCHIILYSSHILRSKALRNIPIRLHCGFQRGVSQSCTSIFTQCQKSHRKTRRIIQSSHTLGPESWLLTLDCRACWIEQNTRGATEISPLSRQEKGMKNWSLVYSGPGIIVNWRYQYSDECPNCYLWGLDLAVSLEISELDVLAMLLESSRRRA